MLFSDILYALEHKEIAQRADESGNRLSFHETLQLGAIFLAVLLQASINVKWIDFSALNFDFVLINELSLISDCVIRD